MGCNWNKLVEQGRVNAPGLSWTPKEHYARYTLHIPAEFVRNGCLTKEDYFASMKDIAGLKERGEELPLKNMDKADLLAKAGELGFPVTPEITRADLILLIQSKLPEEEEKVEEPWCDSCDSKGGRHKKECPKKVSKAKATSKQESLD